MFQQVGTYLSVCWQPDSRWWFALQPTEIPQFIHRERNPNRHWMRFNDAANLQLNWKRLLAIDKSNVRGGTPEPLFDRTNLHPGRVPYCLSSDTRSPLYTFASASSGTLDSRNSAQLLPLLPSFLPSFLPYFLPSFLSSFLLFCLPSFLPYFLTCLLASLLPPFTVRFQVLKQYQ